MEEDRTFDDKERRPQESMAGTCIIINEVEIEGSPVVLGVLADSVQEVIDLYDDHTEFIQAMGKLDEEFIIILNMDNVFSTDELEASYDESECAAA